jgi:hypothetical protein
MNLVCRPSTNKHEQAIPSIIKHYGAKDGIEHAARWLPDNDVLLSLDFPEPV